MCLLRILVGCCGLVWWISLAGDWNNWFGIHGLMPTATVARVLASDSHRSFDHIFSLPIPDDGSSGWPLIVGLCSGVAFTIGLVTPISGACFFLSTVAAVQRAPMIFGPFEQMLSVAVGYLTLAPSGQRVSVDSLFRKLVSRTLPSIRTSIRANVAVRLLQVHLAIVYLFSGLSKLNGDVWWQGDAIWWLAVQPESSLLDLTWIAGYPILMNLWTYLIVCIELAMGTLIWIRRFRPVLVCLSALVWVSLVPLTAQVGYCTLMVILNFVFLAPDPVIEK
jgi:hypothetical protein